MRRFFLFDRHSIWDTDIQVNILSVPRNTKYLRKTDHSYSEVKWLNLWDNNYKGNVSGHQSYFLKI